MHRRFEENDKEMFEVPCTVFREMLEMHAVKKSFVLLEGKSMESYYVHMVSGTHYCVRSTVLQDGTMHRAFKVPEDTWMRAWETYKEQAAETKRIYEQKLRHMEELEAQASPDKYVFFMHYKKALGFQHRDMRI